MGNLFNAGGVEPPRPFKARRLGHVGFYYDDLKAAEHFYVNTLGLRVSHYLKFDPDQPPAALFVSNNADHHSMACISSSLADKNDVDYLQIAAQVNFPAHYRIKITSQLRDAVAFLDREEIKRGPDITAELLPSIDHAVSYTDPAGHSVLLYFSMEKIEWDGKPRPAESRRKIGGQWPERISTLSGNYADQMLFGPIGWA